MIFVRRPLTLLVGVSFACTAYDCRECAMPQNVTPICVTLKSMATAVSAPASTAGPIDPEQAEQLPRPPFVDIHPLLQLLHFNQRQIEFVFRAKRELGDVFALRTPEPNNLIVTSLPDDVRRAKTSPSSRLARKTNSIWRWLKWSSCSSGSSGRTAAAAVPRPAPDRSARRCSLVR